MDVAVIGAGPAGSTAACAIAERGYSVTVYERGPLHHEKPCGGGVSDRVLLDFNIDPKEKFWDRICEGIFVCSPKNETVYLKDEKSGGYFVMREKFDDHLIKKAQNAGVKFIDHARCQPYVKDGMVRGVKVADEFIESRIVIACDGTPSSCARYLGINTGTDYNQAATYQYQMKMDNAEIDELIGNNMQIYFGHAWTPCGYSWIFPKDGMVSVGNGTWLYALKKYKVNLKRCLDRFIHEHPVASPKLQNAEILYPQSAMIGFTGVTTPIFGDNFMIAGDAAGFVSVPTGEGIYYSMWSGRIAGETAVRALTLNDCSRKVLHTYRKVINKKVGADMKWGYWLRRLVMDKEKNQERMVWIHRVRRILL
ncbi:MAG: NAD(P)/FAD-dependent oxidoreductase [Theionarchaea archaeon]|nr:NAD(P)/FAD-dependent oxidoreductase [Theionarchaea archaeon]